MPRRTYKAWAPRAESQATLDLVRTICAEYAANGYDMTLRQVYYQMVARGYIQNNQASYDRLGSIINRARLAGLLDWNYIVDRTRNLNGAEHFARPADAVLKAARNYNEDLWASQPLRIEVWVEKEALAGVIERVAQQHDVDSFACRGYVSQSELWSASQRIRSYIAHGQRVLILHLGDHDPSGIDMTRDMDERLHLFIERDWHRDNVDTLGSSTSLGSIRASMVDSVRGEEPLEIRRIALNMDQVEQYSPPPNFAKQTDSRFEDYQALYGDESWELDALEPQVIHDLIEREILVERDDIRWERAVAHEEDSRGAMVRVAERWDELVRSLPDVPPADDGENGSGVSAVGDDFSQDDLSGEGS
jgi:hypothetical protein